MKFLHKKSSSILLMIVFGVLFLSLSPSSQVIRARGDSCHPIKVEIKDAYYGDFDGGAYPDDVYTLLEIKMESTAPYVFFYIITLVLPSGAEFSYFVSFSTSEDGVFIHNYFYNHATESGDYTVSVRIYLWAPGFPNDSDWYVFDPPGGSSGGDPTFLAFQMQ
ncbi:MAG: hypothetical protein ACFFBD_00300 [Candidatus Hodarchaeota archaeon]